MQKWIEPDDELFCTYDQHNDVALEKITKCWGGHAEYGDTNVDDTDSSSIESEEDE